MGLGKRLPSALAMLVLAFASTAQAGEPTPALRTSIATPFEAPSTAIASAIAGKPAFVDCVDAAKWQALGDRLGFDPAVSWAVTPFHWDPKLAGPAPDGSAVFSPRACRFGTSFWLDPSEHPAGACRAALRRARDTGEFSERDSATCDLWSWRLTAIHVLSHEAVHLRGVYDEAEADCIAVQLDAWVAMALGADETFARALALEYWADFHLPRMGIYQSAACHDGGRLDLFPTVAGWPTPDSYPADLDASFATVATQRPHAGA